jgi:tetratricopeptide (TPR) repeat protein
MDMEKKKGKIIRFPKVRERLIEKGLEALQAKQYKEALRFFYEADEIEPNDPEVELSIIVCLFELGEWEEAKERCQHMLQEGRGDDIQLLQIYLSILIHLQQYRQVEATIRVALQERRLPPAIREHFIRLLHFSQKMSEQPLPLSEHEDIHLLTESENVADHMKVIKQLEHEDITPVLPILKQYLVNEKNNPMTKTMILRLLTLKKVSDFVTIKKFGDTMTVAPASLDEQAQTKFAADVLHLLERNIANKNPSLYEVAADIWLRYTYVLYPFLPNNMSCEQWAAAAHITACQFQGGRVNREEIEYLYDVRMEEIDHLCRKLHEIGKISYF